MPWEPSTRCAFASDTRAHGEAGESLLQLSEEVREQAWVNVSCRRVGDFGMRGQEETVLDPESFHYRR